MAKKKTFAPKQARSQESESRLLKAAVEILNEKGLAAATVPRVAARAGLSAGSVYRRFPDKDALLRTVVLGTLESLDVANKAVLTPQLAKRTSLRALAEVIVEQSLRSYRKNVGLLRALYQFTMSHPSQAFRLKVAALNLRAVQRVADFLLLKRKEVKHPHPERAVLFALMQVGITLQGIIVLDTVPEVREPWLPKTDEELARELTRVFLGYLKVD